MLPVKYSPVFIKYRHQDSKSSVVLLKKMKNSCCKAAFPTEINFHRHCPSLLLKRSLEPVSTTDLLHQSQCHTRRHRLRRYLLRSSVVNAFSESNATLIVCEACVFLQTQLRAIVCFFCFCSNPFDDRQCL